MIDFVPLRTKKESQPPTVNPERNQNKLKAFNNNLTTYLVLSGCAVEKVSRRSPGPNRLLPSRPSSGWS